MITDVGSYSRVSEDTGNNNQAQEVAHQLPEVQGQTALVGLPIRCCACNYPRCIQGSGGGLGVPAVAAAAAVVVVAAVADRAHTSSGHRSQVTETITQLKTPFEGKHKQITGMLLM